MPIVFKCDFLGFPSGCRVDGTLKAKTLKGLKRMLEKWENEKHNIDCKFDWLIYSCSDDINYMFARSNYKIIERNNLKAFFEYWD